jgi:iron complex transport system substrate-binding protein
MRGKICSLLPSATEIVFALGLDDRLVGVTHECDFPAAARRLPVVTRTVLGHEVRDSRDIHRHIATALHEGSSLYLLDQSLLERLDPELILTQELCDVCAVSYALVKEAVLRSRASVRSCRSSRRVSAEYCRASSRWPTRPGFRTARRPW